LPQAQKKKLAVDKGDCRGRKISMPFAKLCGQRRRLSFRRSRNSLVPFQIPYLSRSPRGDGSGILIIFYSPIL
jgi:hypothetical protein